MESYTFIDGYYLDINGAWTTSADSEDLIEAKKIEAVMKESKEGIEKILYY